MWKVLPLSLEIATTDFKLRNEGSYLGIFWYLLNPLLLFGLLYFIFQDRLGNEIPFYAAYLFIGLIMFNFFQKSTLESSSAIISNGGLIKSINFPREVLIHSVLIRNTFSHLFEILILIIIFLVLDIPIYLIIFYIPIFVFLYLFTLGASFFLSSMNVHITDLNHVWQFFTLLLWFGTPIFYSIPSQQKLFFINLFNPLFHLITAAREIMVYSKIPDIWIFEGIIASTLISLMMGIIIFNKLKINFAEKF